MTGVRTRHVRDHGGRDARPRKSLIPFDDAVRIAVDLVRPIGRKEHVPTRAALRRVAAEDVRSGSDVPLADRAAMDGYAVRARDTVDANRDDAATLRCIETLHADGVPRKAVTAGHCAKVATGTTLPNGADAVVMVEETDREGDRVRVFASVKPGENVSRRGGDIARGSVVVHDGDVLMPAKLGALAAVGLARVRVYVKPQVSILVTGDEVVPLGRPIRVGQVYDINSHTIAGAVQESGGEPVFQGRVPDRLAPLRTALKRATADDIVVVSGGSSVGEKDIVVEAIESLGDLLFHGVAVKPGRPTALGLVDGTAVLGMPGNPTSCLSNGYVLLAPMVRRMARLPPREEVLEVPLAARLDSKIGRVEFHTVRIVDGRAVPAFKESGAITSMAHADGYVKIPADVDGIDEGETVRVVLF